MSSRILTCITAMALFAALAIPVSQAADDERDYHHHKHHHYKLIILRRAASNQITALYWLHHLPPGEGVVSPHSCLIAENRGQGLQKLGKAEKGNIGLVPSDETELRMNDLRLIWPGLAVE